LELATPEEAQRAVNELHGIQILGQAIRVEISIPKHLKAPKWKRSSSSSSTTTTTTTTTTTSSSRHPVTSTRAKVPSKLPKGSSILPPGQETNVVFVGNLSDEVTERDIRELFKRCGPIKEIRWLEDKKTGKFRGYKYQIEFTCVFICLHLVKVN
jgi:RNA recognition motif-containing protein